MESAFDSESDDNLSVSRHESKHVKAKDGQNGVSLSTDSDHSESEDTDSEEDDEFDDADNGDHERDIARSEFRRILEQDKIQMMAPISQSVQSEAAKGIAVRQQRRGFDALLNVRIRLQKALVAVNSFGATTEGSDTVLEVYQAAEEAAIRLLNTINGFRSSSLPGSSTNAGQKRKRETELDTSSEEIWKAMEDTEGQAMVTRKAILDTWSNRVRRNPSGPTRNLIATPTQNVVAVIEDQLAASSDRLIKRTRTPRSCAPKQVALKIDEDVDIYDDADFYQLLLKELVDQRTGEPSVSGDSVPTVRWAAIKEAKTRKTVDRRASKGRKMRYTVHEKLLVSAFHREKYSTELVADPCCDSRISWLLKIEGVGNPRPLTDSSEHSSDEDWKSENMNQMRT